MSSSQDTNIVPFDKHKRNMILVSKKAIVPLIVFATAAQTILGADTRDVDRVVGQCIAESNRFAKTEEKYAKKGTPKRGEPLITGVHERGLQLRSYEIELRQRPFECVTNRLDGISKKVLWLSTRFRALVRQCKSGRPPFACNYTSQYRTIDGTCNNPQNPRWGSSMTCVQRLLPANYEKASDFRKSICGNRPLPDPRFISLKLLTDRKRLTRKYNNLMVFFGEFLAHDMTEYVFSFIKDNEIECCKDPTGKHQHPQCSPILLKSDDPFYSRHNISCFNFYRRAMCDTCSTGRRMPMNLPTTFLDCSTIYGSYDESATNLRTWDGTGKMRSRQTDAGELLPPVHLVGTNCGEQKRQQYCFAAGDRRVNLNTILMMMHTIFLREHNRIAEALRCLNPHWNGEKLYQEARKISIAQFQVIVYEEFLPILIGPNLLSKYGLEIGTPTKYEPRTNPAILVEFNAAAYRLHSILPGKVIEYGGVNEQDSLLRNMFVNAVPIYEDKIDSYLLQTFHFPGQKYDRHIVKDVTDFLYKPRKGTYGFDLAALNIQRGRDIGLPTYTEMFQHLWRKEKGIDDFDDLYDYMDRDCVEGLKKIYCDVRDIDLWVGLNCERVTENMAIGPTAGEIVAEQFRRLKYGDRFYFEHDKSFSLGQQRALKQASLSKIICDNTNIDRLPPKVMEFPSKKNAPLPCSDIPVVNLQKWKENV